MLCYPKCLVFSEFQGKATFRRWGAEAQGLRKPLPEVCANLEVCANRLSDHRHGIETSPQRYGEVSSAGLPRHASAREPVCALLTRTRGCCQRHSSSRARAVTQACATVVDGEPWRWHSSMEPIEESARGPTAGPTSSCSRPCTWSAVLHRRCYSRRSYRRPFVVPRHRSSARQQHHFWQAFLSARRVQHRWRRA